MNSRQKGVRGERELAKKLREYGFNTERTGWQQSNGGESVADVSGINGLHIECKRVERLNIYDALSQSRHDSNNGDIPIVAHRKNNSEWLITLSLDDFINIWKERC